MENETTVIKEGLPKQTVFNPKTNRMLSTSYKRDIPVRFLESTAVDNKSKGDYFGMIDTEQNFDDIGGFTGAVLKTPVIGELTKVIFKPAAIGAAAGRYRAANPEEFEGLNEFEAVMKSFRDVDKSKILSDIENTNRTGALAMKTGAMVRGTADLLTAIPKFTYEASAIFGGIINEIGDPKYKDDGFLSAVVQSAKSLDYSKLSEHMNIMEANNKSFIDAMGFERQEDAGFWTDLTQGLTGSVVGTSALNNILKLKGVGSLSLVAQMRNAYQRKYEGELGYGKASVLSGTSGALQGIVEQYTLGMGKVISKAPRFMQGFLKEGVYEEGVQGVMDIITRSIAGEEISPSGAVKEIAASMLVGGIIGEAFQSMEGVHINDLVGKGVDKESATRFVRAIGKNLATQENIDVLSDVMKFENDENTYEGGTFESGVNYFKQELDNLAQQPEGVNTLRAVQDLVNKRVEEVGRDTKEAAILGAMAQATAAVASNNLDMTPKEVLDMVSKITSQGNYVNENDELVVDGEVLFQLPPEADLPAGTQIDVETLEYLETFMTPEEVVIAQKMIERAKVGKEFEVTEDVAQLEEREAHKIEFERANENLESFIRDIKLPLEEYQRIPEYKKLKKEYDSAQKAYRESIVLRQDAQGQFRPAQNLIELLETANRTTLLHEGVHSFMNTMTTLNTEYRAKYGRNLETYDQMVEVVGEPEDGVFARHQWEQLAAQFEAFAFKGEVKNPKLKEVFRAIRDWFVEIYQSIDNIKYKNEQGELVSVDLSPQAEQLFNDLLSSQFVGTEVYLQESYEELKDINERVQKGEKVTEEELTKLKELRDFLRKEIPTRQKDFISYVKSKGGINLDTGKLLDIHNMPGVKDTVAHRGILRNDSKNNERDLEQWVEDFTGRQVDSQEAVEYLREALDQDKFADLDVSLAEEVDALTEQISRTLAETGIDLDAIDDEILLAEKFIKRTTKEAKKQNTALLRLNKKNSKKFIAENISRIQKSDMTAEQKNKYESRLRNAQDALEADFILREINEEIYKAGAVTVRADLKNLINKELKSSKPKKEGNRSVGRYNYPINQMFDKLREINRMKGEEARDLFDKAYDDKTLQNLSEEEGVIARFIQWKGKGKYASIELSKQVAQDMKDLTAKGKIESDTKNYEDLVVKKEHIDEAIAGTNKTIGDKDRARTKASNVFLNSIGNLEMKLNTIFGKTFMEKWSLLNNEKKEFIAVNKAVDSTLQRGKLVYGIKDDSTMLKHLQDMGRETDVRLKKKGSKIRGKKLSKLEMIDIYNARKNEAINEDYIRVYGEDQLRNIEAVLTDADKLFAGQLMDTLKEYYPKVNNVFVKLYNKDMPRVQNYWTSSFENQSVDDIFSTFVAESQMPGITKQRGRTRKPVPVNAFNKVIKYVNQAEYLDNVGLKYRDLQGILKDIDVKEAIIEKRGDKAYNSLLATLQDSSIVQLKKDMDSMSKFLDNVLGNWITAKIGLNPDVFLKQLISTVNYTEQMDTDKWVKGFAEGLANPKEAFDFIYKDSEYLQGRYQQGYSEALQYVMNGVNNLPKAKNNLEQVKNFLTITTRIGDIGAIVYGGYPLVKYYMSEEGGGLTKAEAIDKFEDVSLRSQQSPFKSSLSTWQNAKDPVRRMLFSFANTPSQYARKIYQGNIDYINGDITLKQLAKVYAIYAVFNGVVYALEGAVMGALLFGEPIEEDDLKQAVIQVGLTPFGGFPIIKDGLNSLARSAADMHAYGIQLPAVSDMMNLATDIGTADWINVMKTSTELGTGVPVKKYISYYDRLTD